MTDNGFDNGNFVQDPDGVAGSPDLAKPADDGPKHQLEPAVPQRKLSIASMVIAAVLVLCGIAGIVVICLVGVLPTWALVLSLVVDVILVGGLATLLLASGPKKHSVRFWISTVLAVVVMVANLGVVKFGTDYLHFGHSIQAPASDTVLYDIVVMNNGGPSDVSQLAGGQMGDVQDDPLSAPVQAKVLSLAKVSFVSSTPWTATVEALTGSAVSSIVIQDGYMQILEDSDPDTYALLKVLTSFDIDSSLATAAPSGPSASATSAAPVAPGGSYILYISGIDTYGNINDRSRSDVNILVVVNPSTGKILLVNTPRDFYVQLAGTTGLKDKLTHSGVYGINVSVGTMQDLYGITINYYLRINFSSLVTVIDALGGVDVNSAYNFSYGGYTFTTGMNHLNGAAALAFSRDRHDFAEGDRTRGENQERVIEGVINKLEDPSVLMNYQQILSGIQSSIQTSMPPDVISQQVKQQLTTNQKWNVTATSVTGSDSLSYTYSYPNQRLYVMVPDQSTVDAAKAQIQSTLNG